MTLPYRLFPLVALAMLTGCIHISPQPAHWIAKKYWDGTDWQFVCDNGGKVIAEASNPKILPSDNWAVFGGDGNGYGEYNDEESAKHKAEWVTRQHYWILGGSLDHCP